MKLFDHKVSFLLKRFADAYCPKYERFGVNLQRKWWHTYIEDPRNRTTALKFVAMIDKHLEKTAQRIYVCKTPEDDARLSEFLVNCVTSQCFS